jgi:hypothetical protein
MTEEQIEAKFVKYERLLHKLAWEAASRCGRPERELYAEACFQFMRVTETWDEERGQFGTFLYRCVWNGLAQWGMRNKLVDLGDEQYTPEATTSITPESTLKLKDWLESLSEEARQVVRIILDGPAEVLDLGVDGCKCITRKMLREYLREQGWQWKVIHRVMVELKEGIKSF